MSEILPGFLMVSHLAIIAILFDIALHLRKVCRGLGGNGFPPRPGFNHHGNGIAHIAGFSIWVYEGGRWSLLTPCGQKGCDCGPPPAVQGEYEGQVIRKECPKGG